MADYKEKPLVQPKTKKQCTRGQVVHLPKQYKGYASTILNKEVRRQYLNMMLDAIQSEKENKMKKKFAKDEGSGE